MSEDSIDSDAALLVTQISGPAHQLHHLLPDGRWNGYTVTFDTVLCAGGRVVTITCGVVRWKTGGRRYMRLGLKLAGRQTQRFDCLIALRMGTSYFRT